jgi:hypothetical protein
MISLLAGFVGFIVGVVIAELVIVFYILKKAKDTIEKDL